MVSKQKILLLVISFTFAAVSWLSQVFSLLPYDVSNMIGLVGALIGVVFIGHSALGTLMEGVFGIDVLATVAILASILVGEYIAAAIVVIMLGGGEVIEEIAFDRATSAIDKLVEGFPQNATVIRNGVEVTVPISDVNVGETVLVKPGGIIPVDGVILSGKASVNQASITGEPMPVQKTLGDDVFSGSIIELGALELEAVAIGDESTYGQIISMVTEAQLSKAPIVSLADKFASYYIPLILVIGLAVYFYTGELLRMASVFVIACPCALTLATPTAIVSSMGNSAKKGILIRHGESLEQLAKIDTLVFDKTGTLTEGKPRVVEVIGFDTSVSKVLSLAAGAERHSEHPLARAVIEKAELDGITPAVCSDFEVYPGLGICVTGIEGKILVGAEKLLRERGISMPSETSSLLEREGVNHTTIFVALNDILIGALLVSDAIREDVKDTIDEVHRSGSIKIVMLTGDRYEVAKEVGDLIGVDNVVADLMPNEKVAEIQKLRAQGKHVLMVGDGINDAPALAASDVGVAMGLTGTDIAIETAGITLATNRLDRIPQLLKIGKATMRIIKLNIGFALLVNFIGIILSVMGIVTPLVASMLHEGNAVLVMINSLRLLNVE